jgi:hypothetical protein
MKQRHESKEIVETREVDGHTFEICATAIAQYDHEHARLVIELDCFLRRVNLRGPDEDYRPAWLPRGQRVEDEVSQEEASEETRDAFHRWSGKIREAISNLSDLEGKLRATLKPAP